ncbi:transposase [Candidatus Enterovibrio escicola]|uniref:transposase n=2 Tax=Candidatus Enterovibrio escicola TaxID=1927127 RepID=UPI0021E001E0|nr:transposase [Candidatus Enterovibrio escacola]
MHDLDAVFVDVDDFCQTFLPVWKKDLISSGVKQQNKPSCLSASEVMLIMIAFHQSKYRDLKTYYIHFVYTTSLTVRIPFVNSSKLQVYNNLRILRHQVFKGTKKREKGTMGWFYGFKLHLIINDQGGIISVKVMTTNVDDRILWRKWLTIFGGIYTETKVISLVHWSGNLQTRE